VLFRFEAAQTVRQACAQDADRRRNRAGGTAARRRPPGRRSRGPVPRGRGGSREAVSVPPCEIRHRGRCRRVDRIRELRRGGISSRRGPGESRVVRGHRGPGRREVPSFRLRSGLRSAAQGFPTRRRTARALGTSAPDCAMEAPSIRDEPGGPAPRGARYVPRPGGPAGRPDLGEGARVDPGPLHRHGMGPRTEPVPRGRLRRGVARRERAHPAGWELVVHAGRRGRERRTSGGDQSTRPGPRRGPRGAPARTVRPDRAAPQQGARRRRAHRLRLEHELGGGLCDGEPGGRGGPRGPRTHGRVRGGLPGGLGRGERSRGGIHR